MKLRKSISRILAMIAGAFGIVGAFILMGSAGALQLDNISILQFTNQSIRALSFIAFAICFGLIKDYFDRKFIYTFYKNR